LKVGAGRPAKRNSRQTESGTAIGAIAGRTPLPNRDIPTESNYPIEIRRLIPIYDKR